MTRDPRCPICEEPSGGAPRCDCGYDFAERDTSGALVRLGYARQRASGLLRRGSFTVVATAFPLLALSHQPLADQLEIVTIIVAQLTLGAWWAARGVLDARTVQRRLRAVSAMRQLPAARVVHGLR